MEDRENTARMTLLSEMPFAFSGRTNSNGGLCRPVRPVKHVELVRSTAQH